MQEFQGRTFTLEQFNPLSKFRMSNNMKGVQLREEDKYFTYVCIIKIPEGKVRLN